MKQVFVGKFIRSKESKEAEESEEQKLERERKEFIKKQKHNKLPDIDRIVNIYDLQALSERMMKKESWDYYISGADDEITLRENESAFQRIWLKPRVLINVSNINTNTKILGYPSTLPIYFSATALTKFAHPDGDLAISRAAGNKGLIQMFPTLSSCSIESVPQNSTPDQVHFFQLYLNTDRSLIERLVKRVEGSGFKALCITVDAPVIGRRERDIRNKYMDSNTPNLQRVQTLNRNKGVAKAIGGWIDPSFSWDDLRWIKTITNMPIVLKGIQTAEDAILAVQHNIPAIIISNHGGRQLDSSRSGIEILEEVVTALKRENLFGLIEIWVDGGIRRGTDVFKALAMGATAVGIGRPMLYGLASYGQEGVEKVIDLFRDELTICMGNMGTPSISDINSSHVITKNLGDHYALSPTNYSSQNNYKPILAKL